MGEWANLVLACAVADDTIESSWLERKGLLDLRTAGHKFTVAKAILAFANREPQAAAPFLDGHALVLIGIEKTGEMPGIPRIEDHELINALKAYLGQGDAAPRWVVQRHRVDDDNAVIVIDIDAPHPGDPIFTLKKEYAKFLPGAIFARQATESAPADPEAIAMLSRRLKVPSEQTLGVDLTLNEDAISSYTYDPSFIEPLLDEAVGRYLNGLAPEDDAMTRSVRQGGVYKSQLNALKLSALVSNVEVHQENRTEDEFRQQVDEWADSVRRQLPDFARRVAAYMQPSAEFTIHNACGLFLEDVELEVHIEGSVFYQPTPADTDNTNDWLPRRPRKWGPWEIERFAHQMPRIPSLDLPSAVGPNSIEFHNSGSVSASLTCKQLRPDRTVPFGEDDGQIVTLLTTDPTVKSARVMYTVTARGIHDAPTKEIVIPVTPRGDITPMLRSFSEPYFR